MQEKSVAKTLNSCQPLEMPQRIEAAEAGLAALARRFRKQAKKTRAQAAREMRVSHVSIFHAEESPEQSLAKLRRKMIEAYSPYRVVGPVFHLEPKE
jgi:hypothetical protein